MNEQTKVIIAGGRDFTDEALMKEKLEEILTEWGLNPNTLIVISGHAKGTDQMAEDWASQRDISLMVCPANWNRFGRAAGHIRNRSMAEIADGLVAFWDGKSRGTRSMIGLAAERELRVAVVNY